MSLPVLELTEAMKAPTTPDGKLGCRSCPHDFRFPATHIAHPRLVDGSVGDDWPVCTAHMQWAMVAGWYPIEEIK